MQHLILENRWIVLFTLEIFAWSSTFFMLYARYKMQSSFWFKTASVLFALTGVIPQVSLGIVNLITKKELDLFSLAILLLIIYGLTIGKKQAKQLDSWAKDKFAYGAWRDKTLSSDILLRSVGRKFLIQEVRRLTRESGNLVRAGKRGNGG